MKETKKTPQLGQIVKILKGRDTGNFAIIVRIEDEKFVYLADGDKRKFDRPKKKNLGHVELFDDIAEEVAASLHETGRVTNGKLRYALARYVETQTEAQMKGDENHG